MLKAGVDVSFTIPEGSFELPQEQLASLSPGQKIMEDNGVRLNVTYSADGSRAYVTPLKEDEVVDNEQDSGGFFGFKFKNAKSMPDRQQSQQNIINNQNISPSSSSYKRAFIICCNKQVVYLTMQDNQNNKLWQMDKINMFQVG